MQLTTQDESVCLQPLREGHHKLMPLRHKHKGRGTRISYAKDSSTFMEIKGLWRKVCMCNMDDFFKSNVLLTSMRSVSFHCSQGVLQSKHT